jgi:hypothetical protein
MTRADFFSRLKVPIFEAQSSNTKFTLDVMDSLININQTEWWAILKDWGIFSNQYQGILPVLPVSITGTTSYLVQGATKVTSTISTATASGGLTTIADTAHISYITTDGVGVGDKLVVGSGQYQIVSVTNSTVVVYDANAVLSGSTSAYTIISDLLFPVLIEYLRTGSTWPRRDMVGHVGSTHVRDYEYNYSLIGGYIYPADYWKSGTIYVTYAGNPVVFGSPIQYVSNPFMMSDSVCNAFVLFMAAKYFETQSDVDAKMIALNNSRWENKLSLIKASMGQYGV